MAYKALEKKNKSLRVFTAPPMTSDDVSELGFGKCGFGIAHVTSVL